MTSVARKCSKLMYGVYDKRSRGNCRDNHYCGISSNSDLGDFRQFNYEQ